MPGAASGGSPTTASASERGGGCAGRGGGRGRRRCGWSRGRVRRGGRRRPARGNADAAGAHPSFKFFGCHAPTVLRHIETVGRWVLDRGWRRRRLADAGKIGFGAHRSRQQGRHCTGKLLSRSRQRRRNGKGKSERGRGRQRQTDHGRFQQWQRDQLTQPLRHRQGRCPKTRSPAQGRASLDSQRNVLSSGHSARCGGWSRCGNPATSAASTPAGGSHRNQPARPDARR